MIFVWLSFCVLIMLFLALDLGVFNKKSHVIAAREALSWTCLWVSLAMVFNVVVYFLYQHHWVGFGEVGDEELLNGLGAALQFLTAYIVEYSLSLDNVFVIALIISFFKVPPQYQHRVLFWGIFGALVLRGVMILVGAALLHTFLWITYVFGGLLIFTAIRLLVARHEEADLNKNFLVRWAKRFYPVTPEYDGQRFFTTWKGRRAITPMFLVLLVIESSDVLFAVDSIPACFAVTRDPFLVFTSNVFAILGLRSLYFALASVMRKFKHLKTSLVFILAFVGVKMILTHHYKVPTPVSLAVIIGVLGVGIIASMMDPDQPAGAKK